MTRLTLSLLGPPQLRADGQPVALATRKTLALLAYLAVEARPAARESLVALLWPEAENENGRGALRTTLAYLRRGLGPAADRLRAEADYLAFALTPHDQLDTRNLEAAAASDKPADWQAALAGYAGDFLAGFSPAGAPEFEAWAAAQRQRFHERLSVVFERLSRWQLDERQYEAGLSSARRWTEHDPLNETAWRRRMQVQLAAGDRTGALQSYEAARELLARELGLAPSRATSQLADQARQHTAPPSPTARAVPAGPLPGRLPFVGRVEELRQLVAAYRAGAARLIILQGEAGIGKTRLAEEFLAWAGAQGAEVLRGRAFEAGGRLPYQSLVEALRARLAAINAPEDLLADAWLAELSRLLPELRERYPDLPAPDNDEALAATRLPEAMGRLLGALAQRAGQPLVLLVDDVQWADAASLDALAYLARRFAAEAQPMLLVLTTRLEALAGAAPLAAWRAGLPGELPVMALEPGPMSPTDVSALLEHLAVSPATAAELSAWLLRETHGQPFFVAETLKALAGRGWPPSLPDQGLLPASVREMIRARLSGLLPAGRDLLTAAAVLGRPASFDELGAVAGLEEASGLLALEAALTAHLLVETAPPRPYWFTHDQVREVVLAEAGQARRRVFHRRALATTGLPPAELAHHALAASLPEPAFQHSLDAAEAALRVFAVRDALGHFEQAAALASSGKWGLSREWTRRLYLGLGRAHELLGEPAQAKTAYEALLAAASSAGAAEPALAGTALSHLATYAIHAYAFAQAAGYLSQAAALAQQAGDQAAQADIEWRLSQLAHHQLSFRESLAHGQRALALGRALGDAVFITNCLNSLGYAYMLTGDLDAGEAAMEEARAGYAALGDRALEVDCLTALAAVQVWRGQPAAGATLAQRAQALAVEIENPWGQIYSGNWLAMARHDQGDLDGALAVAEAGRAVAEAHSFMPVAGINLLVLGAMWRAKGQAARARELHLAAHRAAGDESPAFAELVADELCSDCALLGDWPAAAEYARAAIAQRRYEGLPLVIPLRWTETEALLRAGDSALARDDAQRWGELVARVPRLRQANAASLERLGAEWNKK